MSRYSLHIGNDRTDHETDGRSAARALRELCAAAGVELASQDGRYGRLTDGRTVAAITHDWTRAHYSDARTTRL